MYDSPHDIVKTPLRTEKGTVLLLENKYIFLVDKKANKIQIRKAVEEIYKVNVTAVNTMNVKGKPKRVRFKLGHTSDWKKAIVTLKQGDTIEMAST
ncbi:MAG: 50S ribosomal protein L23 [Candidatus Omnitrophica bacterium]|nr:50S ribosomal protein L23 [Candidatus Omnitrophota bacterium]